MQKVMLRTAVALILPALLVTAQQPAQESKEDQESTFRATVNVVVAPTLVTDRDGNLIHGLQPIDFRLTDNGKLQEIQVTTEYTPISLVVAIQQNANSEPALQHLRKIGPLFRPLVTGEAGEVAVLAFDHRIKLLQDFTSDSDKISEALGQLKPGSSSSRMLDAVVEGSRMLSKRPPNRRRILLLIAETRDIASAARPRQALTDLQFDNVLVYTVNMARVRNMLLAKPEAPRPDPYPPGSRPMPAGSGAAPLPSNTAQLYGNPTNSGNFVPVFVEIFRATKAIFVSNPQEVFTKWTGGKEFGFVDQRDLERAVASIGTELHSQYVISYRPSNRDEGGYHEIQVTVANRPSLKARTRPGYWIAAQPNP